MNGNPVGWFEIYVDDMARAEQFYQTVLNVALEALGDPTDSNVVLKAFSSNMEQYGASGALVKTEGFSAGGNSTLVYFSCEDCAVEEARIETAGGKVHQSKMAIGDYGFITLAVDTEGNMFGLHSQK
ncbi:VOC family protein [Marinicella rhabdoformis]|uniref:VOC family protein n=1 Tax=Marinicella rhabdoformis TaxID=2580566 RepID=UPI0012AEB2FC|nr:VOC family protein [Marinicella rhabdoformis]